MQKIQLFEEEVHGEGSKRRSNLESTLSKQSIEKLMLTYIEPLPIFDLEGPVKVIETSKL